MEVDDEENRVPVTGEAEERDAVKEPVTEKSTEDDAHAEVTEEASQPEVKKQEFSGRKRQYGDLGDLFTKTVKKPLTEEKRAEMETEAAAESENDEEVEASKVTEPKKRSRETEKEKEAAPSKKAKTKQKKEKLENEITAPDGHKYNDITAFFTKKPSQEELIHEKRRRNEEEVRKLRQQAEDTKKNFLVNRAAKTDLPQDLTSENYKDVPLGSLLQDKDINKSKKTKLVSMDDFIEQMKSKGHLAKDSVGRDDSQSSDTRRKKKKDKKKKN